MLYAGAGESLPSRERGSKRFHDRTRHFEAGRSLHGSADRNSDEAAQLDLIEMVAPFTGARIETHYGLTACTGSWSLPSRERGSKLFHRAVSFHHDCRSLHGSADRNTMSRS